MLRQIEDQKEQYEPVPAGNSSLRAIDIHLQEKQLRLARDDLAQKLEDKNNQNVEF